MPALLLLFVWWWEPRGYDWADWWEGRYVAEATIGGRTIRLEPRPDCGSDAGIARRWGIYGLAKAPSPDGRGVVAFGWHRAGRRFVLVSTVYNPHTGEGAGVAVYVADEWFADYPTLAMERSGNTTAIGWPEEITVRVIEKAD